MYRYSVDNAVTYTSEDFVLFRETPFACWMERLSLENPDHGIPPDVGSVPPRDTIEPQDDMADTLRTEGKDVCLIDWDAPEPERRSATLDAMRKGADFIVNAQLAVGPLSGRANLLVRTSGYSEFGDYLYVPCSTQARGGQHAEFLLCFLADLLHSMQGQLPPQMLIIRGGDDLVSLETESHIYHYRAVKQRFMDAMRSFRKHRMPDPAESAHFGRWSDCAHEVLKQRLCREEQVSEDSITDDDYREPVRKAAGAAAGGEVSLDVEARPEAEPKPEPVAAMTSISAELSMVAEQSNTVRYTLAEQANMLTPGTYKAGPGVFRFGRPKAAPVEPPTVSDLEQATTDVLSEAAIGSKPKPQYNRRASDKALQNLEFIGSGPEASGANSPAEAASESTSEVISEAAPAPEAPQAELDTQQLAAVSTAPSPSLRDPRSNRTHRDHSAVTDAPDVTLGNNSVWGLPIEDYVTAQDESPQRTPIWDEPALASTRVAHPAIDMDSTHTPSPPPVLTTSNVVLPEDANVDDGEVEHGFGQAGGRRWSEQKPAAAAFSDRRPQNDMPVEGSKFSNSLMTSDDYAD